MKEGSLGTSKIKHVYKQRKIKRKIKTKYIGGSLVEAVEATGNRVRSRQSLIALHETTSWNGGVVLEKIMSCTKKTQLKYRGVPYTKLT